jgi:hypothetical protein
MKHIKNWKTVNTIFKAYCEQHRNDALAESWRERLDAADKAPKISELFIKVKYRRGREGITAKTWRVCRDTREPEIQGHSERG